MQTGNVTKRRAEIQLQEKSAKQLKSSAIANFFPCKNRLKTVATELFELEFAYTKLNFKTKSIPANSTGFSRRLLDFDYFSWSTGFCLKSPGFH